MIEFLSKGGWVMYVIFTCSVFAFAVIIERIVYFSRNKNNYDLFINKLKNLLLEKKVSDALDYSTQDESHLGKIASIYMENYNSDKDEIDEILFITGNKEIKKMEKGMLFLSLTGRLTPLLGLLGTVLGMILCFQEIHATKGMADVAALAGGIWEALLTTAFGLIVAIPVMAVHSFFEKIVTTRSDEMQHLIAELHHLSGKAKKENQAKKPDSKRGKK